MNKGRLEALTDGIVAIAATIMVLELAVPMTGDIHDLLDERSVFLAYFISFIMIYGVWYLHHNLFERIEKVTPQIFWANGLWIFLLTLAPFTTAWVGKNPSSTWPEFLYALNLLLWTLSFGIMMRVARKDNPKIVYGSFRKVTSTILCFLYFCCMILSFFYPAVCIYIIGIVTTINFSWNTYRGIKTRELES